ncbi:Ribonuclease H-like domain containing protein [Parasponia andersonii]|uniref:Ribonuclease H-like domain containing protein n=1 Tax=Parasponia andersonii TaxID=3476 RepID=A0A2P5CTK4_PARAD|nr:Ribonuclease H-like domain containing protein [Parasponia andersonii]
MTTAAVYRDDTGAILDLFIEKINCANAASGKALAILSAIKLAEYINEQDIVIESNSKVIMDLLKKQDGNPPLVHIDEPIREAVWMCASFPNCIVNKVSRACNFVAHNLASGAAESPFVGLDYERDCPTSIFNDEEDWRG